MNESKLLVLLYAFKAWTGTNLPLYVLSFFETVLNMTLFNEV